MFMVISKALRDVKIKLDYFFSIYIGMYYHIYLLSSEVTVLDM